MPVETPNALVQAVACVDHAERPYNKTILPEENLDVRVPSP